MTQEDALFQWTFPDTEQEILHFTADDIAQIRCLVAVRDIAETGAPGLVLPDGDFLEADDLSPYIPLFLSAARLDPFAGVVENALLSAPMGADEIKEYLSYIPDKEERAKWAKEHEFPFQAGAADLALWEGASFCETVIDPKRPFGTGNVTKEIRALLGAQESLPSRSFPPVRRRQFSRMIAMLQLFVQQAALAPGSYCRSRLHDWRSLPQFCNTGRWALPQRLWRFRAGANAV